MGKLNFSGSDFGMMSGGTFIIIGFVVLAMVAACRCYEGLASISDFRKAAGQVVMAVYFSAINFAVYGLWLMFSVESNSGPSKGEVKFIMFFSVAMAVGQLILIALAIKNLLSALDRK